MKTRSRAITLIALTSFMMLSYQNCGSAKPGTLEGSVSGEVNTVGPIVKAPDEKKILDSVLSGYQGCDGIADITVQNQCRRAALEQVARPPIDPSVQKVEDTKVCYVFGPGCSSDFQRGVNPVMAVQACRNELFDKGFSIDSVNALMSSDPLGYAEMINSSCLYDRYRCVIAVRCISQSEAQLPGAIQ